MTTADVMLTCGKCGHETDFFDFCHTPITGDLPRGTHQCPACKHAWRMEKVQPDQFFPSGLFIPGQRKAVTIPSML